MAHRWLFPLIIALAAIAPGSANADWINLTGAETASNIAEIYVLDDRVKLILEIYVGDLEKFQELVPDDLLTFRIEAYGSPEFHGQDTQLDGDVNLDMIIWITQGLLA